MAKSENQKLKLLYLKKILEEKTDEDHGLSVNDIIFELEKVDIKAERKSIYTDLQALEDFGVDIIRDIAGNKTRYKIGDRLFELPELKLLVDSIQTAKFISPNKSKKLIEKLESLTSKNNASELQRQVHVDDKIKTQNERLLNIVDELHKAIQKNKKISFKYFDYNADKKKEYRHNGKIYIESPWHLIVSDGKYYMLSYNSLDNVRKTYRVDKMDNITRLDEARDGRTEFKKVDLNQFEAKSFSMFGGEENTVSLHIKKNLVDVFLNRFGLKIPMIPLHGDEKPYNLDCHDYETAVSVYTGSTFYSWIMNFGSDVMIVSPEKVKKEFTNLAKDVLKNYED